MQSKATTVDEYLKSLPVDRQGIISTMRKAIQNNLPKGFEEKMNYGMMGYVVPHSLYPSGYHCDPKLPLPFISLASQKNYISLYHMGLYEGPLLEWLLKEWPKHSTKKLDIGKCCIRFKKPEDVPIALLETLFQKMTPQDWIKAYEKNLDRKEKK